MGIRGSVGGNYETPESGLHKARCIKVIDKGTHYNEKFGNRQRELNIMFELLELKMKEGENKGKPFATSLGFGGMINLSMSPKSNLRPIIEGWVGIKFTDKEAAEFDIDTLIGKPALINIIHTQKDGNTYANIAAVMPLKDEECAEAINPPVVFSVSEFDQAVFDKLPEKTRERIQASDEWDYRFKKENYGDIQQAMDNATDCDRIDFKAEFEALPKKTYHALMELAQRKMGMVDFNSFFSVNGYPSFDKITNKDQQMDLAKQIKKVCENREFISGDIAEEEIPF